MPREIELKLSVPETDASRVWKLLAAHPHSRPVTRKLYSAYYDTPRGHLLAHGVALRLRRQSGRWIQTIKRDAGASAGLHERIEHESPVATQLPDLTALADAGFGNLAAKRRVRTALDVAFTTEFARRSALFRPDRETQIEVAVDRGTVNAGGRSAPICEIELELKAGSPQALFTFALEIVRELPVRLDSRSKAERGYALALGKAPAPVKAVPSGLGPDATVEEAFVRLASECVAHLQANERGLLEGRDPEYLHQARVAIRRMRSLLRIFSEAIPPSCLGDLPERLKALGRSLGHARNFDVLAGETLAALAGVEHPGLEKLRRRVQARRRAAGQLARAAVAAPEYVALLLQLGATLQARPWTLDPRTKALCAYPCQELAGAALARLHERARKRGRNIQTLPAEALHRLRIDIKRLRYASEFFLPLARTRARAYLEPLTRLQDLLGRLSDDAVACRLLDEIGGEVADPGVQQAIGLVRGWSAAEVAQVRAGLEAGWKQFERARRFWREPSRQARQE